MKDKLATLISGLLLGTGLVYAEPLGTAFTYQGRLDQNGQAAPNGIYQITAVLFTQALGGTVVGSNFVTAVPITNGLFNVDLDFGAAVFLGDARWLELRVRANSSLPFEVLSPRIRIAPTPSAIYASTAGTVTNGAIRISQLGTVGPAPGSGQVLGYDGNSLVWTNRSVPGGLTLPYAGTASSANPVFQINNSGAGAASDGILGTTASSASQVSAVRGVATSASGVVVGVYGRATNSPAGTGIVGYGGATGGYFTSTQPGGRAGVFDGDVSISGSVGVGTNLLVSGRLGLGVTSPSATVDVNGAGYFRGDVLMASAETEAALGVFRIYGHAPSQFPPLTRFVVRQNGNVGIGTGDPIAALEARGNWDGGRPALQLGGPKPSLIFAGDGASGNRSWLMHVGSSGPGNLEFYDRIGAAGWRPIMSIVNNGDFLRIEGGGGEAAYLGSDSAGGDVHVGSLKPGTTTVALYNQTDSEYMHLNVKSCTVIGEDAPIGVTGRGFNSGVHGVSSTGNGVTGQVGFAGVHGNGAKAIHGVTFTTENWAGYFQGKVQITTDLEVLGFKNFKIDHPLDPANKYLRHSCVESPDVKNIYDGNITTDASGEATVMMPSYFEALNCDFRYQLTVIGQFAQAIVAREIKENHFIIKTDKPSVKVSWQVTGIRQDAYVKAHPMVVEEDKPANERGTYQHPELFSRPEEKGLAWGAPVAAKAFDERSDQAEGTFPEPQRELAGQRNGRK